MSDNENKGLCPSCSSALWCGTWGQFKCMAKERHITGYKTMTECTYYKKRPAGWKEMPCRCEDCLKSELLNTEIEEEN